MLTKCSQSIQQKLQKMFLCFFSGKSNQGTNNNLPLYLECVMEEEEKCLNLNATHLLCRHLPRRYKKLNIKSRPDSEGGDTSNITAYTRYSSDWFLSTSFREWGPSSYTCGLREKGLPMTTLLRVVTPPQAVLHFPNFMGGGLSDYEKNEGSV